MTFKQGRTLKSGWIDPSGPPQINFEAKFHDFLVKNGLVFTRPWLFLNFLVNFHVQIFASKSLRKWLLRPLLPQTWVGTLQVHPRAISIHLGYSRQFFKRNYFKNNSENILPVSGQFSNVDFLVNFKPSQICQVFITNHSESDNFRFFIRFNPFPNAFWSF